MPWSPSDSTKFCISVHFLRVSRFTRSTQKVQVHDGASFCGSSRCCFRDRSSADSAPAARQQAGCTAPASVTVYRKAGQEPSATRIVVPARSRLTGRERSSRASLLSARHLGAPSRQPSAAISRQCCNCGQAVPRRGQLCVGLLPEPPGAKGAAGSPALQRSAPLPAQPSPRPVPHRRHGKQDRMAGMLAGWRCSAV